MVGGIPVFGTIVHWYLFESLVADYKRLDWAGIMNPLFGGSSVEVRV